MKLTEKTKYIFPIVFGESDGIYEMIFGYRKTIPSIFREDAEIYAVRGVLLGLHWCEFDTYYTDDDGVFASSGTKMRRYKLGDIPSTETIAKSIASLGTYGIKVQVDFSNPVLRAVDTANRYGNFVLRELEAAGSCGEAVVASSALENYIFDVYPDIAVVKGIADSQGLASYAKRHKIYAGGSVEDSYRPDMNMFEGLSEPALAKLDIAVPLASVSHLSESACKLRLDRTGNGEKIIMLAAQYLVKPEYQLEAYSEMCSCYYKTVISDVME